MISQWNQYVQAVTNSKKGEWVPSLEFGVLGSPGISAGAFLVSPYSTNGVPDIQLTVFPTVSDCLVISFYFIII